MKNPAEELVTAWFQECLGFFTMSNIKVPLKRGGAGAEIDILATNRETNLWCEVSVSTNPRCNYHAATRFRETVEEYLRDFRREDKNTKAREIFRGEAYERWLVYGKLALPPSEVEQFEAEMLKEGVKAVRFSVVFHAIKKCKGYRLDAARGYMNLFNAFYEDTYPDPPLHRGLHEKRRPEAGKGTVQKGLGTGNDE